MNNSNKKPRFDSKKEFHKERAQLPYELKVKQIIELQKIDIEFSKYRKGPKSTNKRVWEIED